MLLANVAVSFNEHERHEGLIIADGFAFSTHGLLQANANTQRRRATEQQMQTARATRR
jgi:hypothetical protein